MTCVNSGHADRFRGVFGAKNGCLACELEETRAGLIAAAEEVERLRSALAVLTSSREEVVKALEAERAARERAEQRAGAARRALERLNAYGSGQDAMDHADGILEPGQVGFVAGVSEEALRATGAPARAWTPPPVVNLTDGVPSEDHVHALQTGEAPKPADPPPCPRCDGTGKAIGSDRPFEWSGPGTYPGPCPKCGGTGKTPPKSDKDCAVRLWNAGTSAPKTCELCGLGPCVYGEKPQRRTLETAAPKPVDDPDPDKLGPRT